MPDLKLNILLQAADKLSKPFGMARDSSARLRSSITESARKVRDLEKVSADLDAFRRLKMDAKANAAALAEAQAKAQRLGREMATADTVTKKMRGEFARARQEVKRLEQVEVSNAQGTLALRNRLKEAGIDTRKLGTEQKRLKTELDAAAKAADREGKALERAGKKANLLATARAKLDRTLQRQSSLAVTGASGMAAGGSALALGSRVAGDGINFEETLSGVAAVARLDTTSEAFARLRKQAEELGATTDFSASEAAQGMQFLAMAGFKTNGILTAMPGMLNLAKAGATDLGETADIASNILSGFGLEADQMGRVGDVLAATFTRSNVNLSMLGQTMKYVAPIAKEAGTSIEDAAAMAGLLGNVGIQADQAGTALRALHNRMAAPPAEAARALTDLGVSVRTAEGDMRPMVDILAEVAKKTEGLGSADRLGAFKAIAGAEAGAAMAALVEQGGAGEITQFAEVLRNAQGEAARIAAQMRDNVAGDLKGLGSAVEGFNIALTQTNAAPLREVIQALTGVVRGARDWVKENPRLAGTITKVAAAVAGLVFVGGTLAVAVAGILGPFAMARFAMTALGLNVGGLASGFSLLSKGVGLVGTVAKIAFPIVAGGIRAIGMALTANPIGVIVMAIAAAAYLIYEYWEPIKTFFSALWDRVKDVFAGAWEGIKAVFFNVTPLGLIIKNWEPITAFFSDLWERTKAVFARAWEGFKSLLSYHPLALIYENWEPIKDFFAGLWDGITGIFDRAIDAIAGKLKVLKAPLDWVADQVGGLFGGGDDEESPAPARPARGIRATAPKIAATAATVAALAVPAGAAAPPVHHEENYRLEIHAAPGMDEAALAREIRRQLEERDRRARSAARGRLYDGEK